MSVIVSVIIPVYNASSTIRRCVESLVFGKISDVDIILVDDCSSDDSWEVCLQLSEQFNNVRCIKNEKNRGVSYTRNQGLKAANGQFVLFVDSDDWVSSDYVSVLLENAKQNEKSFVLCGYRFFDYFSGRNTSFLYGSQNQTRVERSQFLSLVDSVLIQQLWNKVFRLDIIRQHNLSFDVNQSMGEDFQFVLDYMKAASVESCLVINRPLYYYIRANNSSLMSKMGLKGYEQSQARLTQLAILTGERNTDTYYKQIENLKRNYLYQIVHDANSSRTEKLCRIETVMQDGNAVQHYRKQVLGAAREKVTNFKESCAKFQASVKGWVQRKKRSRLIKKAQKVVQTENITIISQNCIGGVFYHDMGIQFQSPTINLYFSAADFVKFVLHLKEYLSMTPEMAWEETYPIGILGDITIRFMHYETCTEALEAWEKRKKRVRWDKIVVFSTDMEGFDENVFEQWKQIPYPKVLFTAQKRFADEADSVYYPLYENNHMVPDLIPNREFYREGNAVAAINSFSD